MDASSDKSSEQDLGHDLGHGLGLALAAGAARGFAHIPVLQAFDRQNARPSIIAGTSMGAVIGSLYAAGMSGDDLRNYVSGIFSRRADVMSRLWSAQRKGRRILRLGWSRPTLVDAEGILEAFLPGPDLIKLPDLIEDLPTRMAIVAVDFNRGAERVFTSGPLLPALAASIAVPGLIRPVRHREAVFIDGACANPLPIDVASRFAREVVGVNTVLKPQTTPGEQPGRIETIIGATEILLHSLIAARAAAAPPALMLRPPVSDISPAEFFQVERLLEAGDIAALELEDWLSARAVQQKSA